MKHLILITSGFPYGSGETFLESEITYLSESAEKIMIYVPCSVKDKDSRPVPSNCEIKFYKKEISSLEKVQALGGVFSKYFWEEIKIIRKEYALVVNTKILSILLIALFQAKRLSKQLQKEIISTENQTVFYSYWADETAIALALLNRKYKQTSTLTRIHGWDVYFEAHATPYLPLRKLLASSLGRIISISQDGIKAIRETWKVDDLDNVLLSRLGVKSIGKLDVESPRKEQVLRLVSCSNVIPVKRVSLIARALENLDFRVEWTHFGDGVFMESLKKQVTELPKNIHIDLRGRVPNTEIYENYSQLKPHVFINVSASEGVPVSIMEAMSFGIPCIATNVGGNGEIVSEKNGSLLEENVSTDKISEEIRRYFNMDSIQYQNFSSNAFSTWECHYNMEKNYGEFVKKLRVPS